MSVKSIAGFPIINDGRSPLTHQVMSDLKIDEQKLIPMMKKVDITTDTLFWIWIGEKRGTSLQLATIWCDGQLSSVERDISFPLTDFYEMKPLGQNRWTIHLNPIQQITFMINESSLLVKEK